MTYMDFLRSKVVTAPETGFTISDSDIGHTIRKNAISVRGAGKK